MDGGVDAVYMEMFDGIQEKVMEDVKTHNLKTALGRHYQPIGSALVVEVKDDQYLISAPTMWLPEDVSKTRNAYWAFRAVLHLVDKANRKLPKKKKIKTIVCPGLCTGCGFMPSKIAATQIFQAIDHHCGTAEYPDQIPSDPFRVLHDIYPETTLASCEHNDAISWEIPL
jgi:O-acetyl-ADP-ribose deacetylase (regulator of RNase III)